MAMLTLNLDGETFERLLEVALRERRPVPWQAEVLLRQALRLPFPYPAAARQPSEAPGGDALNVCRGL
jgi:hypothetical protein